MGAVRDKVVMLVGEALAEFEVKDELDGGETSWETFAATVRTKCGGVDVVDGAVRVVAVLVMSVRGLIGTGPVVDKCANIPGVAFGAVGGVRPVVVPGRMVKVLRMAWACWPRRRELSWEI